MPLSPLDIAAYVGLVGVIIALFVSTAHNKWQPRVFAILALRLAVGWHFCFEGMHKIHSFVAGPAEKNRVFTSEPYFAAGEGPFADAARQRFLGDPEKTYTERLTKTEELTPAQFKAKTTAEQAALCPEVVAAELRSGLADALAGFEAEVAKLKAEAEKLPAGTDAEKKAKADAEAKVLAAEVKVNGLANDGEALRAKYAAWVYGAAPRPFKVKGFGGDDLQLSPDQARAYITQLQTEVDERKTRQESDLGHGYGYEMDRLKVLKADLLAAKNDLAKDTKTLVAELRKDAGLPDLPAEKPDWTRDIKLMDQVTAWTITLVGAGLLVGLFTRLWCVVGAGFLALTYLSHPTIPGLPLPPNTEGNPLFVNKNVIEALALVVVLVHPTGRWLGLDALWQGLGKKNTPAA